jgi:threonine dehydrogenase-like Zn-dependent dehydrogenase
VGANITINSKIKDAVNEIMLLTGDGVDLTVETAGVAATQEQSLRTTKKQGRVLYLGTAHKEVIFPPQSFEKILRNEIKIVGSWNSYSGPYPGTEWTACIDYISQKRLDCKSLVTHDMKLEKGAVINVIIENTSGYLDILITDSNGEKMYKGDDAASGKLSIEIPKTDTYKFSVTGSNAKGSVSFKVAN